ncbi:DUF917 family protein [Geomicrobium sp. JCM 19055]|uniref:S-methyl thiohydantoin desulfurase domain-containing protein n=1 Tax=Geomicrobium sp. JCM 19055 TaxID=1460649 RepID=UPI002236B511|nr:DUF917 family protein [Geomicrobium sp. JCM 19055]
MVSLQVDASFARTLFKIIEWLPYFFENEFVYVASEHDRLATTPDLIVVCEMETLRPLMASTIQKGTEITIAKVACPSILKTEKMRNLYKRND